MNRNSTQQQYQGTELQLLTEFIHELNIARRNFSLYPAEHPQIASSNTSALLAVQKLLASRQLLAIGISPDALYFEQQWLDKSNRVYNDFARFLFDLGIASLSFSRGILFSELLRFNQLLRRNRDSIEQAGGFPALLKAEQIKHIRVTPIDYSAFKAGAAGQQEAATSKILWEGFLQGLLSGNLDARGESADWPGHLDPAIVADALNQRLADEIAGSEGYNRVVSTLVSKLIEAEPQQAERSGRQLGSLVEQLDPKLRDSFLASTMKTLEKAPDSAEQILEDFPQGLLHETMQLQNRQQLKVSNRLVKLVGKLSTTPTPTAGYTRKPNPKALDEDVVRARLNVLFNEESQDLYMPGSYQNALSEILNDSSSGGIPDQEKQQLRKTLEQQSIERQCCAIIFELLNSRLSAESETALQQNLLDLSRFFLDTGDYNALCEIHMRWSNYLNSANANASFFTETVLANQTRLSFMAEVLDGVELWGKEKISEISAYVETVGEAYSEPLIERLGLEQKLSLRRLWMKMLEGIGPRAHPAIIPALKDERWYLVRNLLIVLGKHPELASIKAIQQLANHPHPQVRQEVLRILFRLTPVNADRLLAKELSDTDPQAVFSAIQIADQSRSPETYALLVRLLQQELHSDADLEFKRQLLKTLARIGNPQTLEVLQQLLQKKGLLTSRRQKLFQREIIGSLSSYPQRHALPLLKNLSHSRQRHQAKLAAEQLQQLAGASE